MIETGADSRFTSGAESNRDDHNRKREPGASEDVLN